MKKWMLAVLILFLSGGFYLLADSKDEGRNAQVSNLTAKEEELISSGYPREVLEQIDQSSSKEFLEKFALEDTVEYQYVHQTYSEGALNLEAYTVNHMGDDGKIEACDVVAFYDWNVTSAGGGTDQIFLQWSSEYFTCKSDFVACSYVKNYCSGQKEYYQQRAQTDQAFLGGVGWYLELTDPDISPKIQESPGGYVSASFIPANPSENDVRNAPDFSVLYIHRPATLLFRSEKFINLQISCKDQGKSPGHGI